MMRRLKQFKLLRAVLSSDRNPSIETYVCCEKMSLCRAALLASIANVHALQEHQMMRRIQNHEIPSMDTDDFVDWSLALQPTTNNLGGEGPNDGDAEEMRLPKVKRVGGVDLDLVVRINEEKQDRPYQANNAGNNKVRDGFGITNVRAGGVAHLNFRFTRTGEDATWVPDNTHKLQFQFTIYDIDESRQVQEVVIFDTPVDHLYLAEGHEFHLKRGGINTEENPLYFTSSSPGNGGDNPTDGPRNLDPKKNQTQRAIQVAYKDTAEWNITFQAEMFDSSKRPKGGRNFMWAGGSDVPDAQACTEWAEPTFPWALCDTNSQPTVVNNNLGGLGPNTDQPAEIRYGNVAKYGGNNLDLVVKADEGYKAFNVSRNTVIDDRSDASIHGCFGAINVRHDSKATLTFTFVNSGTNDPAKIGEEDGFGFTVYDLDHNKQSTNEESVRFIDAPYSWSYAGNEVEAVKDVDDAYRSTVAGDGSDNVKEKSEAREWDQIRKSVRVLHMGTPTWRVELGATGGQEGRNFLFGGCLHLPEDVALADHAWKHVTVHP